MDPALASLSAFEQRATGIDRLDGEE